jgi:integrase
MRVRLKGLHSATKELADGRRVKYHYAWRGGPRIEGEPGTPEFMAAYNEAVSRKIAPPVGVLSSLTRYFEQETSEFKDELAERTKADYRKHIAEIEKEFGDLPLAALDDRRTRGIFKKHRAKLAEKSRRQADYWWVVLARVLSVAKDHGKIDTNPCEKGGRLYDGSRRDIVWSFADEELYIAEAPTHLKLPLLLGAWTGQREGDLLRLPRSAYDGTRIRLRQSKTGAYVEIPVVGPLKVALEAAVREKRDSVLILNNSRGRPWTEAGFRSSFFKLRDKIGLKGRTFHDLRGTAVTRLAIAKCTDAEIAIYTGLSLADVRSILDKHYLSRDPAIAESAAAKLAKLAEERTKLQTGLQTGPDVLGKGTGKAQ